MSDFDERQLKEIAWAIFYLTNFGHGTVGHNQLLIIAKLAFIAGFSLGKDKNGQPALLNDGKFVLGLANATQS